MKIVDPPVKFWYTIPDNVSFGFLRAIVLSKGWKRKSEKE